MARVTQQLNPKNVRKYVAITTETMYSLISIPKEAREMLNMAIPVFDEVVHMAPAPDRWLCMLAALPDDFLVRLPRLREEKAKQAAHVAAQLTVYARALLYPTDEKGVRCEMSDVVMHKATNRIFLFYVPMMLYYRLGYVKVNWPLDPFVDWEKVTFQYTPEGIAAGDRLEAYAPAEETQAGDVVEVPLADMELL